MRKLAILLLLALVFPLCSGAVYINELVPNPTDDCLDCTEWVELYNSGDEDVDVADYSLKDSKDYYCYVKLAKTDSSSTVIPANSYLVVHTFNYSFKLRNGEDTIRLMDGDKELDSVSYSNFNTKASYDKAWARKPDGGDFWEKIASTRGDSNGEEEEEEEPEPEEEEETSEPEASQPEEEEQEEVEEPVKETPKEEIITGKVVYVSDQRESLAKPLLLLLLGLLVVIVALQLHVSKS